MGSLLTGEGGQSPLWAISFPWGSQQPTWMGNTGVTHLPATYLIQEPSCLSTLCSTSQRLTVPHSHWQLTYLSQFKFRRNHLWPEHWPVGLETPFCQHAEAFLLLFFFFICFCICWLNASFHQSNETSTAMVSFVLSLAIKPLAGAVYIFICLITTYLLMLNSSYSSLFRRDQEFSFINTHCQNHWTSLAG